MGCSDPRRCAVVDRRSNVCRRNSAVDKYENREIFVRVLLQKEAPDISPITVIGCLAVVAAR